MKLRRLLEIFDSLGCLFQLLIVLVLLSRFSVGLQKVVLLDLRLRVETDSVYGLG
jgi:hypothetical protein